MTGRKRVYKEDLGLKGKFTFYVDYAEIIQNQDHKTNINEGKIPRMNFCKSK
jgi:hypothetical protein